MYGKEYDTFESSSNYYGMDDYETFYDSNTEEMVNNLDTINNKSSTSLRDKSSMFTPAKVYFKDIPQDVLDGIRVIPENAKSSNDVIIVINGKWYETDGLWIKGKTNWLKIPDINTVIITYDFEKQQLDFNIKTNIWGEKIAQITGKQASPIWVPDSGKTAHITDYPF